MAIFRQPLRALRNTPLVSAIAILSLALGIGANTAMFSVIDALVLRRLPVAHPERLALVGEYGNASTRLMGKLILLGSVVADS